MDILTRIVHRITSTEKLVSGDEVLLIYYVVILLLFLFNRFLRKRVDAAIEDESQTLHAGVVKFYNFYTRHTYIVTNILLYIICLFLLFKDIGFDLDYLLTLTLSFGVYTLVFKVFLNVFVDEESYKSAHVLGYLNIIYYTIIAAYFTFFSPYVRTPGLLITFVGLFVGVIACAYIMVQAIINPTILRRSVDAHEDVVSYGIIRGMLGIVICIFLIEYMMVYACFKTSPDFYGTGEGRILNAWDMFYFFVISFTTIGYGDIYPQRFDGMYYSEFASIIIGLSSMFTTACFIAAVISTASSIAKSEKPRVKKVREKKRKT